MDDRRRLMSADYYQRLHDSHQAFQNNNWLAEDLPVLRRIGGGTVLELGCGNGRFLAAAAAHWRAVVGVDWAKSPLIDAILADHANVRFVQADVTATALPGPFDIVASADFLEHLPESTLPQVIARCLAAGPTNYHKIACYDDGHSHLSILAPEHWLALFQAAPGGESMRVVSRSVRKARAENVVVVLCNAADPTLRAEGAAG